jgi:formamidopyrimidine-DNA glycosylase
MPELPEVETTRRGLLPHTVGLRFTGATIRNASLRYPVPGNLDALLKGKTLIALKRRGKYLMFEAGDGAVIVHLGMSGSLRVVPTQTPVQAHEHVGLLLGDRLVRLRDPRRFGMVLWAPADCGTHPLLASLGMEPLEDGFSPGALYEETKRRAAPIKNVIMDSHIVTGVGNIYAAESLFRAGIRPDRAANRVGLPRIGRLVGKIKDTLMEAIEAGGSSLRDFVGSDGKPGYFQQQYFVYGREGLPCRVCGTPIRRILLGQRATCFCSKCQR